MMLRRSLAPALYAAFAAAGFGAQPVAAPVTTENLNLRYANGIVAVAEDKIITVADVSREIAPLMAGISKDATNQKDYETRVEALQDSVIQDLIDRVLIIKEFKKDEKKHIPDAIIDAEIARMQSDQFDNDRSKFLAYLRIPQGAGRRDHLPLHAGSAAQVAKRDQPGEDRDLLQRKQGPLLPRG